MSHLAARRHLPYAFRRAGPENRDAPPRPGHPIRTAARVSDYPDWFYYPSRSRAPAWVPPFIEAVAAVRCPTLVILGEHDATIPTHLGREIVEAIPDGLARLELVPHAAHEVIVDSPAESYRLVRQLLADLA